MDESVIAHDPGADPCVGKPMCMLMCPHGFVKDEHGCDSCECAEGNTNSQI